MPDGLSSLEETEELAARSRHRPRPRWRPAVAGAAVALLATTGCDSTGVESASTDCTTVEKAEYPTLEDAANETLRDVPHTLIRHSRCEDAGTPGAAVIAKVTTWSSNRDANRFFAALKWTPAPERRSFISPDGDTLVSPLSMKDSGEPTYVAVYFTTN